MVFGKKIQEMQRDFFVGREQEFEIMRRHISGGWPWLWLHIYGQSGIGKSTLLNRFKSEIGNFYYFYLSGHNRINQIEDLLIQLAEQLKNQNESSILKTDTEEMIGKIHSLVQSRGGKVIFLIDEFDHWRSAEDWLIPWLAQLNLEVRIISVGRHPLTGGWLRSGYSSFIYSMQISALSPFEVERYAVKREISDKALQTQLVQFSRGVPLAMVLAAENMLRGEENKALNRKKQLQLSGIMMDQLLQGLPSYLHRLIDVASVYWCFNEERIAKVMDEEIDAESFRRLTALSFVIWKDDGWMLHDAVRAWALEDLQLRRPQHFENMRRKALQQIRLEERSNPERRGSLQVEKMNLHDNPLVRNICFSGHIDDVELSECCESDLPDLLSLYTRYHQYVLPENSKGRQMEQLIRPIWEVEPTSFITIRKKGRLIGFYGKIPLNEQMVKVLAKDPLLKPFTKGWKPRPKAFLMSFLGVEPELEEKTRAYIIHTVINHLSRSEWILFFTCLKEWFPVYEFYGFEPIPWADAKAGDGTEYRAFVLDLTEEDLLTKLDRSLSGETSKVEVVKEVTIEEALPKLKMILKEWANLPGSPSLYETYLALFPHRIDNINDEVRERLGFYVQQDLKTAIDALTEGEDDRDEVYGKLLKYTYIHRTRPHERVAERLNLSMATYYRYLNKALDRLVKILKYYTKQF